jgi:hypothetical protein
VKDFAGSGAVNTILVGTKETLSKAFVTLWNASDLSVSMSFLLRSEVS